MALLVVELFAGPGGASEGICMARPDAKVVGVEWDEAACATARAAGHHRVCGDVRELDPARYAAADYLHASPACQGFSMAGKGAGRKDGVNLLRALGYMAINRDQVPGIMAAFDAVANDHRSVLTLEHMRWIAEIDPAYVTLEQVPTVLPVWEATAEALRAWGYRVWTGKLHSEMFGVPQTRTRAVLIARKDGSEATPPPPTHSRFYSRDKARLDPGVLPWVTMAQALGWGMTARPYVTVATGTGAGGTDPQVAGGSGARKTIRTELEGQRWAALGDVRSSHGTMREADQPAPSITASADNGNFQKVLRSPQSIAGGDRARRQDSEPSVTVTGNFDRARWELVSNTSANAAVRGEDQPASTMYFGQRLNKMTWEERVNNQSGTEFDPDWPAKRPAPTVAGREIVTMPGANANRFNGATKSRNDGLRITVEEAGILQSFPAGYPWQGTKTKQFEQVGNAVPPLLMRAIADHLLPDIEDARAVE